MLDRRVLLTLTFLTIGLWLPSAFAAPQQQSEAVITADKQEKKQDIYRASGNVVVTYEDVRIEADTATYNDATKELAADGHVRFRRSGEHLAADRIEFNLQTKSGTLTNPTGELGPGFFVTASEVRRTEEGRYELRNATITSCENNRPGWTLTLARAFVDPNRRMTARNSVFRLQNIPIFYLPYIAVPTENRSRSTGFLIPTTSTSTSKGRSLRESFFYAINRSVDALFSGEYFSKRGPAGDVRLRAVPAANSNIDVSAFFAHDRLGQGGESLRILSYGDLGRGFRGVADMNLVSSFVFRQVYEEGFNIISSPLQHSIGFLSRNDPDASVNILYSRSGVFFTGQATAVLQKFPSLEVSTPEKPLGNLPVYFSLATSLSGIARHDAAIATPFFVERFDLHPTFEFPLIRSDVFDWSQQFGVRETAYTQSRQPTSVENSLNRFSFDYTSNFTGPRFERDFGSWRHVIEPSVEYHYLTGADRFRNTIVVDDVDMITNTNQVEYALTNRLFTTREIFSWRLAQTYFFDPTFGGALIPGQRNTFAPLLNISGFAFADGRRRFSPIVSTMRISTTPFTSTDFQADYDTEDHIFRSAGIIGNLNRGQALASIAYFFTRHTAIQFPSNQLRGTIGYGNELKPGLSAAFNFSYDVQHSLFQGSAFQVGYNKDCYGLSFEFSQFDIGARKESRFRFAFSLKNVGSYGTLRPQERLF